MFYSKLLVYRVITSMTIHQLDPIVGPWGASGWVPSPPFPSWRPGHLCLSDCEISMGFQWVIDLCVCVRGFHLSMFFLSIYRSFLSSLLYSLTHSLTHSLSLSGFSTDTVYICICVCIKSTWYTSMFKHLPAWKGIWANFTSDVFQRTWGLKRVGQKLVREPF